jgi:hypothetical protein
MEVKELEKNMTIVSCCSLFFFTVTKSLFSATMDGRIIMN